MILDPWYGVYGATHKIAKALNRLTLLAELGTIGWLIYQHVYKFGRLADDEWFWVWIAPASLLGITLINFLLRWLCDVFMVILYGTADEDRIYEDQVAKVKRYNARQREKWERRMARNAERERKEAEKAAAKAAKNKPVPRIAYEPGFEDL